jgi:hypothetical protein
MSASSASKPEPTPTSVEDFLTVDTLIPGQNYVCLSFLSPEKVLKKKENHFYSNFVNHLLTNRERMLSKDSYTVAEITEMIDDFRFSNGDDVDREFDEQNSFQTSIRGVKIRGVFDTLREAQVRSEQMRKRDPNHNVFVGQMGYWLPWDPEFHKVQDVNYQETHLNELMKKYNENTRARDEVYNDETKRRIQAAKTEGRNQAESSSAEAQPATAQPATAQPATAQSATAQPATAQSATAQPAGAEPAVNSLGINEEEAKSKIAQMREIVDEKDKMFTSVDPWTSRKNI